jgi:hypothetical protein
MDHGSQQHPCLAVDVVGFIGISTISARDRHSPQQIVAAPITAYVDLQVVVYWFTG